MKLKAAIALAIATTAAAPTFASGPSFSQKLDWAADVSTHIYDVPNMETFKPSLEFGLRASLPVAEIEFGRLTLEGGLSQTLIYGSSDLIAPMDYMGYSLETSQVDFRRLFVGVGFETNGQWFFKPEIGFEHNTVKLRLYDPGNLTVFNNRETDSNAYASLGLGYRVGGQQRAILSFATLGDEDGYDDYRVTYTAFF